MWIERDNGLRGWWIEYDKNIEDDAIIIEWRARFATKEGKVFIADSELKDLIPIVRQSESRLTKILADRTLG